MTVKELRELMSKANISLDDVRGTDRFVDAFREREIAYETLKHRALKALPALLDVVEAAQEHGCNGWNCSICIALAKLEGAGE